MTPRQLMEWARQRYWPFEKMQAPKRQSHYTYVDGPMYYLGQQIVKAMEDAGYPAKISECYRSPERQKELYHGPGGVTRADAWRSAHQFYEAVDIIHPARGWNVTDEYWQALASCVRIVAQKYGVKLEHGHHWVHRDSAHIEMEDWRTFREYMRAKWREEVHAWEAFKAQHPMDETTYPEPYPPTSVDLAYRFEQVLPTVWKQRPQGAR